MSKFQTIKFAAPKWIHWLAIILGISGSLSWLGYVAYVSETRHLGMPAGDEQLDIALVAVALFLTCWFLPLLSFRIGTRLVGRFGTKTR